MAIGSDITADDLKVFLQEAEGLLDTLDEDIIRLEQEVDNKELLDGIFRVAHTLKGSSGMLGFESMAGLTHEMEDLLDRVRRGTLPVTPELIDALLMSLDGLKVLKDSLKNEEEATLDIAPLVAALKDVMKEADDAAEGAVASNETLDMRASEAAVVERLGELASEGVSPYRVIATLDPESEWTSVRSFQMLNELSSLGETLASLPSEQEIEDERAGYTLEVLFAGAADRDTIEAALASVADVISVVIEPWEARSEPAGDPPQGEENRRVIDLGTEARGKSPKAQLEMASAKIETLQTVRIDVDTLDELMNLVGELVIDRTRIAQLSRTLQSRYKEDEQVHALGETSDHVGRIVDELHESMMQVRMLPVGVLFSKFPRLVRDLSRNLSKEVDFVVEGEGTEIDRSVIEKIKDPLVHMIRNAVDHGVEIPEVREAAGKPARATVKLSAVHAQGHILITLVDDGKGIDPQAIREAAVRKGQMTAEAAERLSDSDAIDLIFQAGLSTATETTEVSGRGVGMDVVRRDIESLNGRVKIESTIGKGSTFTLTLPLTLATFGGLLVRAGASTYAIPLSYVQETVRPERKSLGTVLGKAVLNLRGTVMPLAHLADTVGGGAGTGPFDGLRALVTKGEEPAEKELYAVVVKAGENESPIAIGVDELVDQHEIVVKALSGALGRTEGVSGASILGDGQVVLIVDIPAVIKKTLQRAPEPRETEKRGTWKAA